MIKKTILLVLTVFISACLGCSSSKEFKTWAPLPEDSNHVPVPPDEVEINILKDAFKKQIITQLDQMLDLPRTFRKITRNPKEALNVDPFGEVYNSTWYTNRNTLKKLTLEEIARGPNTCSGPDQSGPWTIKRAKSQGVTPGFTIKDKNGDYYVIKFEPVGYSELSSGAEVVSTKLFYAAGYYVPENYITYFDPSILLLDEEVSFTDVKGKKRNMNSQDLDDIINRIEILPNGKIRAIASKYIVGDMLGPFKYYKTRKDDPNDFIPHNYRRELRGMRVLAAWLGHYDTKANNSYDAFITDENGNNYVRHYMMDFGSTLGSQSSAPKQPFIGFENQFDTKAIFMNIITLGLYVRPYEKFDYDDFYPSIGRFTSEYFHPQRYKFIFPNPAFESMTDIDGYWGARLVMSFTDEQIRAVVESAQYTNDEAREYLMKTLIERRDIAGRYWFDKMPPLDYFAVSSGSGSRTLSFKDLAIDTGLESTNGTTYKYEILDQKKNILNSGEIKPGMNIALPEINLSGEDQYIITRLNIKRDGANIWSKGISLYLTGGDYGGWKLIGVRR